MSAVAEPADAQATARADQAYAGYAAWKGWDRPFSYTGEEAQYFKGEARGVAISGADVLEIGFGSGGFLAWAREQGAQVAGVEIIPELIDMARSEAIELLPADLEDAVASNAGRFDTIVAFDMFEHMPANLVSIRLRTCASLLKPGGHMILRFPNGQSPFGLVPQAGDPTHRSMLSQSAIGQLIQGAPLEVVHYAPSYRITGGGLVKGLVRRLRYFARDMISGVLNFIYAENIPWDAVVVIVLRKRAA